MREPTPSASIVQHPSFLSRWVAVVRERVRDTIQHVMDEELEATLGAAWYGRSEARRGYRNGTQRRRVTSEYGPVELEFPRARIAQDDGTTREWRSHVLGRYQRRTDAVNSAVLGAYLAGTNTRRIRPQGPRPQTPWQEQVLPLLSYLKQAAGTVSLMLGPSSPFSCSDELVREVVGDGGTL